LDNNTGKWWDKLGAPQYGGEITIRANRNIQNFDPYFDESNLCSIQGAWMEGWPVMIGSWIRQPGIPNWAGIPSGEERPPGGKLGVYRASHPRGAFA